jgi:hypothetical protein
MNRTRRIALAWILLSSAISIVWGLSLGQSVNGGSLDFQAIYYGTRCLIEHHDPYIVSELESVYRGDGGESASESPRHRQTVTLYVNLPTTFVIIAPFAMLPFWAGQALWLTFLTGVFILAAFLMWDIAERYKPGASLFLICILLANSELIFGTGNTAGVVVGLCVVAVWCFLEERFVLAGVLCLGASLAIKPHDVGLVWLYFLLASGVHRKRALQALLLAVLLGLSGFLWVSHVAPQWMQHWQTNMASISGAGGLNEPGPSSVTGRTAGMVIDLQAAVSIFRDDPRVYNSISYLVCGALLLAWAARALRTRISPAGAWLALAAIVPLTMLVTYHRPYDAKLLLLTFPACAMLCAKGGPMGRIALLVNAAAVVFTGDVPLAIVISIANKLHVGAAGLWGKMLTVVLTRPASLILLAMGAFYLWAYLRRAAPGSESGTGHANSAQSESVLGQ